MEISFFNLQNAATLYMLLPHSELSKLSKRSPLHQVQL